MSVSEKDAVLRERAAFRAGYDFGVIGGRDENIWMVMRRQYPLPKVTQPRTLFDEYGCEWRVSTWGGIEWRGLSHEWGEKLARGDVSLTITRRRAEIIASLVANPTEEVEDAP